MPTERVNWDLVSTVHSSLQCRHVVIRNYDIDSTALTFHADQQVPKIVTNGLEQPQHQSEPISVLTMYCTIS